MCRPMPDFSYTDPLPPPRRPRSWPSPRVPDGMIVGMSDSARQVHGQAFRTEHDSMGEVQVPADALWGAQTQRASTLVMSGERMPREVIIALAQIKSAAAAVNADLGVIDPDMARAIQEAADEIAADQGQGQGATTQGATSQGDGTHRDHAHLEHFPLD